MLECHTEFECTEREAFLLSPCLLIWRVHFCQLGCYLASSLCIIFDFLDDLFTMKKAEGGKYFSCIEYYGVERIFEFLYSFCNSSSWDILVDKVYSVEILECLIAD